MIWLERGRTCKSPYLRRQTFAPNDFGLQRLLPGDAAVFAQPLYLSGLKVAGALHNVVFVATEHNSVYAYDADTGAKLWQSALTPSGETTSDDRACNQVSPEIGVTATPVIDRQSGPNGAIYLVAVTKDSSGHYHQRLHALDITTGGELFSGPSEIQATYPTVSGRITVFDPAAYKERAGLLLLNGESIQPGLHTAISIRTRAGSSRIAKPHWRALAF